MFGENKCKVITIGENHDNNWTLGNIHLEVLESYKYISNDGSMTPHITEKIHKSTNASYISNCTRPST